MRKIELANIGIDLFHQFNVLVLHESHLISIRSSLLLLGVAIIANICSVFKRSRSISAPDRHVDGCRRQHKERGLGAVSLQDLWLNIRYGTHLDKLEFVILSGVYPMYGGKLLSNPVVRKS